MIIQHGRVRLKPDGTRWRTGGEVKGKLANGVGSQYSHATSERGVSSITNTDAHTSAASSWPNRRPRVFKWTRPFRRKTKSGFCAFARHVSNALYSCMCHLTIGMLSIIMLLKYNCVDKTYFRIILIYYRNFFIDNARVIFTKKV